MTEPATAAQIAESATHPEQGAPPQGVAVAPPRPATQVAIDTHGLKPTTLDELWRMAALIARSELVPKDYRNKPENVAVAIEMSLELGIPIMQGVQNIAVINGRPGIFGDLGLALVEASGLLTDKREWFDGEYGKDTFRAICVLQRRGRQAEQTEFSVADARQAKLWGKEGPWSTSPKRMLQMRARWFNLRNNFADILKGVQAAEEIIDITPAEPNTPTPEEQSKVDALKEKLSGARATEVTTRPAATAAPDNLASTEATSATRTCLCPSDKHLIDCPQAEDPFADRPE